MVTLELNIEKIKQREMELIRFNGFVPMDFLNWIDNNQRNKYLRSIGKYEEIQKENYNYRVQFKQNGLPYKEQVLKQWMVNNPQFKDLVDL